MIYYADYEALEFNSKAAQKEHIFPYYLDVDKAETALVPIFFSAAKVYRNEDKDTGEMRYTGDIKYHRRAYGNKPISFVDFLNFCVRAANYANQDVIQIWFHNLNYDYAIIRHELYYNDFTHIVDDETGTMRYIGEYSTDKTKAFTLLGKNFSAMKGVNIFYKGCKFLVRDTMGILDSAQDRILHDFGKDLKTDVDWQSITLDNLKENMLLIEKRNFYDTISLGECLEEFKDTFYHKFKGKGKTAASMSFDALKHFLCVEGGVDEKHIDREIKDDVFREMYPMLSGIHKEISDGCYSGGISTINPKYAGQVLEHLQMVDINSSYPYSMTFPLPVGEGKQIDRFTKKGYSEYIVYIEFEHTGTPFQRCNSESRARNIMGVEPAERKYKRSEFPPEFKGYLCINSIDLDTLKKYARVKLCRFCMGINYETTDIVSKFITPIYEERKHSTGVLKLAIKLLLNSLYGKFAQDLSDLIYIYDGLEEYHKIQAIDMNTMYKPFASAVTAYSRRNWINTVNLLGDNYVYGDTDSAYFINPEHCLKLLDDNGLIHPDNLGKWALDDKYGDFISKGKFLSKKNYIIEIQGRLKVTCVGLSHKYHKQVTFDNFEMNSKPFEVYKMVNIYGGKAMRRSPFVIRERYIS